MVPKTYDFAILGDQQPEGLLLAAALARKGASVAVLPSASLGEKRGEASASWIFPFRVGDFQATDLFFRAGFFRLDDARLQSTRFRRQFLLPRHRLTVTGSLDDRLRETEREFPQAWSAMSHLVQLRKEPEGRAFQKAIHQLKEVIERDESFRTWMQLELGAAGDKESLPTVTERWIRETLSEDDRFLEAQSGESGTYPEFLSDNARKWGVEILDSGVDIKKGFRLFHLGEGRRAQKLILNSWTFSRHLEKSWGERLCPDIEAWLYEERLQILEDDLPEPIGDQILLALQSHVNARLMKVKRHSRLKTVTVTLGTWLPAHDQKLWLSELEKSRKVFRDFMPFLSEDLFLPLPSLLELSEDYGDVVRRGVAGRLKVRHRSPTGWRALLRRAPVLNRVFERERRIRRLHPLLVETRSRYPAFVKAFEMVNELERGRKRLQGGRI